MALKEKWNKLSEEEKDPYEKKKRSPGKTRTHEGVYL
jgi:hypothetical protein